MKGSRKRRVQHAYRRCTSTYTQLSGRAAAPRNKEQNQGRRVIRRLRLMPRYAGTSTAGWLARVPSRPSSCVQAAVAAGTWWRAVKVNVIGSAGAEADRQRGKQTSERQARRRSSSKATATAAALAAAAAR